MTLHDDKEPDEGEEDLFEHYRFVADPGQVPLRIDKFLMDRVPNTSRNKLQNAASDGNIHVGGQPVKSNYKVKPGDEITIVLPYPQREIELIPQYIPIDVLYEDDSIVVVDKPADMVVHPGYGNYSGTLVNALLHHFGKLPEAEGAVPGRPGLVHRLDKNTTGVMVVAKTESALTRLAKQFFDRTIDRRYLALAWGDIESDGEIEGHIGRSPKNRKVMEVFPDGEYGKYALTHYRVLKRLHYVTLVECKLATGRTHQIRVHFRHIGHPLFNDPEYGGDRILKGTTFSKYKQFVVNNFELLPRQALHAHTLSIDHPETGERMSFKSPLPENFKQVIDRWESYISSR